MSVCFTTLGRVGLVVDGVDVRVPGRRERSVLALLLAARGQVVRVDRFLDDVWGEGAASSATHSLQVAISLLRAQIEPDRAPRGAPQVLITSGPGYLLRAPPGSVDAEELTSLVGRALEALNTDAAERAVELCETALLLWTGPPFGDVVDSELVGAETRRLEDLHLKALEVRAEALLVLGRHVLVTGELDALVETHPLNEHLRELQTLALYRSGRQGDALATLRQSRRLLDDELGVDPAPALQQLERDVLTQSVPPAGPVVGALPLSPTSRGHAGFVGRADLAATLEAALLRATRSRGETVAVIGEPGIGKTRLVTEIAGVAAGQGFRVLWGRCHEADVSPAYWPWIPVVRALAGARPGPLIQQLLDPDDVRPADDAQTASLRTSDAVAGLIIDESAEAPLMVVIEDLHWADPLSLRVLAHLAQTLQGHRVLLIVTTRPLEELPPALQQCFAELARQSATRVTVPGLVESSIRRLVQQEAGVDDADLAAVLTRRTDGNPFFALEFVRLLQATGRLTADGARAVPIPGGVQDILRLRLAALSTPLVRVLRVAALVGRDFAVDLVAEATGTDVDLALDLLDEADRATVVEETEQAGSYRFTHALVRETLLGGLSATRRGRLHAAVGLVLQDRLPGNPELITEVADHFSRSYEARPALAEATVRHCVTAARRAEGRGAPEEALDYWERALHAAVASSDDRRQRFDLLLGVARARSRCGRAAESRAPLSEAIALGRELGDMTLVAEAATGFRGIGPWHWEEIGASDPSLVAVLTECIDPLPPGAARARALAGLEVQLTHQWRGDEADAAGREAIGDARSVGDDALLADVVLVRTLAIWGRPGSAPERAVLTAEVLTRHLPQEQELSTRFAAAAAQLHLGAFGLADEQMTRCIELARRLRFTSADVVIAWWRFYRAIDAEEYPFAAELAGEANELHRNTQALHLQEATAMAAVRLGGPGTPVEPAWVDLARGNPSPVFRSFFAHALSEAGRQQEAREVLGAPVPDGVWDFGSLYSDCLRVDVLARDGGSAELDRSLARIVPWRHLLVSFGTLDLLGSVEYFVGRGLEGRADLDGARRAYRQAARINDRTRALPWAHRAERHREALKS